MAQQVHIKALGEYLVACPLRTGTVLEWRLMMFPKNTSTDMYASPLSACAQRKWGKWRWNGSWHNKLNKSGIRRWLVSSSGNTMKTAETTCKSKSARLFQISFICSTKEPSRVHFYCQLTAFPRYSSEGLSQRIIKAAASLLFNKANYVKQNLNMLEAVHLEPSMHFLLTLWSGESLANQGTV